MISLIAAMAHNRVIGWQGKMPWHLPADLRHFKRVTTQKPILMGRKTYDSIGRPLPDRRNIVISRTQGLQLPGCETFVSLPRALTALQAEPEIMVIGGATLYEQCLPMAHRMLLTFIDADFPGDTYFPQWREDEWQEDSRQTAVDEVTGLSYAFVELIKKTHP